MHLRIVNVGKLLRNINIAVLFRHPDRGLQTFIHAFADVTVIMYKDHFRPVRPDKFPSLFRYGIRHDDLYLVSLNGADQSKADPLIAAGRFNDHRIFSYQAFLLRFLQHIECGARLDGAADIQSFIFHKDLCHGIVCQFVQSDDRRMSDRL